MASDSTTPQTGSAPVRDHRDPPRGVLPRHVQMWVMAGLAIVIVLIILIAGRPEPVARTAGPGRAATPTPSSTREGTSIPVPEAGTGVRPTREETPAPGVRQRLLEGTVIETVLLNRLDGTFSGPLSCLVTTPVYTADRQAVVIPAGA